MEWQVRFEPYLRTIPWSVYKYHDGGIRSFEQSFWTEEEAKEFAMKKEKKFDRPDGENIHVVDEASIESFPASDPPAWTSEDAQTQKENEWKKRRKK